VKQGTRVVVLGDGAIGLMFVAVLAHQSAEVLYLGAMISGCKLVNTWAETFNYHQLEDMPAVVREQTEGWGADVVIEATGVPAVWETAIACARPVQQSTCSRLSKRYLYYREYRTTPLQRTNPERRVSQHPEYVALRCYCWRVEFRLSY